MRRLKLRFNEWKIPLPDRQGDFYMFFIYQSKLEFYQSKRILNAKLNIPTENYDYQPNSSYLLQAPEPALNEFAFQKARIDRYTSLFFEAKSN